MDTPLTLVKSPVDERDWHYGSIVKAPEELPERVSLRSKCGQVRQQGKAGFCHSFAGTALKNVQETLERGDRKYNFSPLGLAKSIKSKDGITFTEGSTLLDVCQALCRDGVFDEVFYPYEKYDPSIFKNTGKITFPEMPVSKSEEARIPRYYCKNYARIDTLQDLKTSLAHNNPVLLGITCSKEIYHPTDACIGLPLDDFLIGGHAILVIGYDDNKEKTIRGRKYKGFIECQNSWGTEYGDNGFFWIPYEYLTYHTKDFGIGFVVDIFTTIDLENEDLQGTAVELFINSTTAYDDGEEITIDQTPIIDSKTGRTLVPLRFISERLGCKVTWVAKSRGIIITQGKREIRLAIGSQTALVNGKEQFVDQPPRIDAQTGRTLVPLRFIAQTLGNTVLWDGKRRKITILKK